MISLPTDVVRPGLRSPGREPDAGARGRHLRPRSGVPSLAGWLAAALLLGCGAAESGAEGEDASREPDAAAGTEDPGPIEVVLDEYTIRMPRTVAAGAPVQIRNAGFETHNLRLRLPGTDSVVWSTAEDLDPGESVVVAFDIAPGDYSVVCDFAGHGSRGMRTDVTIGGSSEGASSGGARPGEGIAEG